MFKELSSIQLHVDSVAQGSRLMACLGVSKEEVIFDTHASRPTWSCSLCAVLSKEGKPFFDSLAYMIR